MNRRALTLAALVPVAVAVTALFLRIVPAGSIAVLQNHVGRSDPLLLSNGIHWRVPGWEGIYVYPQLPISLHGEIPVTSKDGIQVRLPFEFKIQLDEQKVLTAHRQGRSGEDVKAWTLRMTAERLVETGRRAPAYQLLREGLPPPLEQFLRHGLDPLGLVEGSLKLGPGSVPPEILATFSPEKLAGMRRQTGAKVAIIGLDGADWDFALPMIRRGELPNLARLRREGAYGKMRTNTPPLSPLLWTTIATGKSPDIHGINDFLVLDSKIGPDGSHFERVSKGQGSLEHRFRRGAHLRVRCLVGDLAGGAHPGNHGIRPGIVFSFQLRGGRTSERRRNLPLRLFQRDPAVSAKRDERNPHRAVRNGSNHTFRSRKGKDAGGPARREWG